MKNLVTAATAVMGFHQEQTECASVFGCARRHPGDKAALAEALDNGQGFDLSVSQHHFRISTTADSAYEALPEYVGYTATIDSRGMFLLEHNFGITAASAARKREGSTSRRTGLDGPLSRRTESSLLIATTRRVF